MTQDTTKQEIEKIISDNSVVLFMKGTKDFPQCGFSSVVVQILETIGVDFIDINVLDSDEMRQGIKDFSDWPTIPQLYFKKELIGGCDIVREMAENGELERLLKNTDK